MGSHNSSSGCFLFLISAALALNLRTRAAAPRKRRKGPTLKLLREKLKELGSLALVLGVEGSMAFSGRFFFGGWFRTFGV